MMFLGGVFSANMEKEILQRSKGNVQYAANQFQWNLIEGLMTIPNIELEVVSAPFVGTYPKEYNDLFFKEYNDKYKNVVNCNYVSFINLWGLRNIFRKNALIKAIDGFTEAKEEKKVILVYSPHTPFLQAAVYAKQKDPSVHICLIVPDLPQYMNLNQKKSILYTQFKKVDIKLFEKTLKDVDSFILITKQMKEFLRVGSRPYIVVEGVVTDARSKNENIVSSEETKDLTIVYTGTLNKKFGVVNLVKAFHEIKNPNVLLKICGRGDASEIVSDYAKKDRRIQYLGQLTNEEAIKIQREATVLVNPRPNNEEFTKYSFPFKTIEYLLAGKPLIAYKLDGIPDEYDEYISYIENDTIDSIKNKIMDIIELTEQERLDLGKKARTFILENKTASKTSRKIYNMINKTMKLKI